MNFNKEPEDFRELYDRVLIHGGFLDGLQFLEYHLQTSCLNTSTIIILGSVGCGKKTLVRKAEELYLKKPTTTIYLDPYFLTDDISALKYINSKIGKPHRQSLQEVLRSIGEHKGRIVIVLLNFEVFCRSKQSLLYCLTDFTRNGSKMNLIGLTTSLDCTEMVEKRVRSRLNAQFYSLSLPYSNVKEYLEFASSLLGGHELKESMTRQLVFQYYHSTSIRALKRYLKDFCIWTDGELLVLEPPPSETDLSRDGSQYLRMQLSCLTRAQIELLIIASCCCASQEKQEMTLLDLQDFTQRRGNEKYDFFSPTTQKNIKLLATLGLLKALKSDVCITQATKFAMGVMTNSLRHELTITNQLKAYEILWKRLK